MLLFNRYEYQPSTDLIGKGELSRVYKAMDKQLGAPVVVKIYRGNDRSEQIGLSDAGKFLALEHPNLCKYLHIEDIEREGAFGETEKMQVCIQELVEGGDLAAFYKKHADIGMLKQLVTGILHGLDYLHGQGVIHRRIKASNLLIAETGSGPEVKIVDFGLGSGQAGDPGAKDANFSAVVVAVPHMAPEQFNVRKYGIDGKVSYNIDFWSLGITLYEVITGESLFRNSPEDSRELVIKNILDAAPPDKLGRLPQPFDRLVARCIVKQADQRVRSAGELLEILAGSEGDTVQLEEPVRSSDDTQVLVVRERPASDDTQVLPAGSKPVVSDDTVVLPRAEMKTGSDDTQVLPRPTTGGGSDDTVVLPAARKPVVSDDTQVLPRAMTDRGSDDTQVLPRAEQKTGSDDTQLLPRAGSDDTQVLPAAKGKPVVSDDTQVLPVREQAPPPTPPTPPVPPPPQAPPPVRNEEMQSLFNRYEYSARTGLIGKGGFSRVYKAYDKKLNRWVALKIYKTSEFSDRYSPIAEIRRVINLDHPNICRYLDIEEIEKENGFGEKELTQICVMELLDGGNLLEYYSAHRTEQVLRKLVNDVLNGLAYLHKNGIIHRDIKPANILIRETYDGPVAKITDFGISKLSDSVNNNSSSALVVSIPYMAPEQLNVKKYGIQEKISFNLDLWALGVTIYELITGKILFKNSEQDSSEQIMTNIMAAGVPDKIAELPQPFYDIVYRCLVKDARERAQKADELIVLLNRTLPENRQAGAGIAAGAGVAAPAAGMAASVGGPTAGVQAGAPGVAGNRPANGDGQGKMAANGPEKTAADGPGKTAEDPAKVTADGPRKGGGFSVSAEEETLVKQKEGKHEQWVGYLRIAVVAAAVLLGISAYIYFQNRKMKQAVSFSAQKADSVSIVDQPAAQKSGAVTDTISQAASSQGPAGTGGQPVAGQSANGGGTAGAGAAATGGSGSGADGGAGKAGTAASGAAGGKSTHGAAAHVTAAGTGGKSGGSAAASTSVATGSGAGDAGSGNTGTGSGAVGGATKPAGSTAAEDSAAMAGYSEPPKKDKPSDSKNSPDTKNSPDIKNKNVGAKGAAGLASKYVLMLTTSQTCSISINNIPYGTLNNGRTMKLYLVPGAYVINATSTAHKSKQYTGRLEVKQEMLDQVGEFKIQL